jgi:hypothetical protein
MHLLADSRTEEPHSIIGEHAICESCGGEMINDEVYGFLHIAPVIEENVPEPQLS